MAVTIGIVGESGSGKSSGERTLDPKKSVIINCDGKSLPFKNAPKLYNSENKNYMVSSKISIVKQALDKINRERLEVKTVTIDTVNGMMLDAEMDSNFRSRKSGGEAMVKWMDLAAEVYDLILYCNSMREDLTIFLLFHSCNQTDINGEERKGILTNGRKLEKIHLETKLPLVLYTRVVFGKEGKNQFFLETQANSSTGKTPMEMFEDFLIPNDFDLIDKTVRNYYGI